jgi:4-diphosphocytidyl-2-C-methyl-D-erythritol kinase
MSGGAGKTRRVAVRALAKINLDLRVLGKRPDGFHELRTIFQTISLADRIVVAFTPSRETAISVEGAPGIADNLMARAAALVLDAMKVRGRVSMQLDKRIPMGAGLGGGSSDAAAVLLALPALAGRFLTLPRLCELGERLGSDVPFFLLGGTAVGIGRGTELFPLPDMPSNPGLLIAPGIHVDTAKAYRDLSPRLTIELQQNKIVSFQTQTWQAAGPQPLGVAAGAEDRGVATPANDFEGVVFEQHRKLQDLKRKLTRAGASRSMMTGSGSAVFGLFADREAASRAEKLLQKEGALPISLVSRARYRSIWRRQMAEHSDGTTWPPRSRHSR